MFSSIVNPNLITDFGLRGKVSNYSWAHNLTEEYLIDNKIRSELV